MNDLLTDAEIQDLVDKVWNSNKERLQKAIEQSIYEELSMKTRNQVVRVLRDKLFPLVETIVEERKDKIAEAVEAQVRAKIDSNLQAVLEAQAGWVLKGGAVEVLQQVTNKLRQEQYR